MTAQYDFDGRRFVVDFCRSTNVFVSVRLPFST